MKKFYDIVACRSDVGRSMTIDVFVMDTDLNAKEQDIVEFGNEFYIIQAVRQSEFLDSEFLDFLNRNGIISGTAEIIYHREIKEEESK